MENDVRKMADLVQFCFIFPVERVLLSQQRIFDTGRKKS